MTKRLDKQHSRRAPSRRRRQEQRVRDVLTRLKMVGKVARQHHFITLVIGICLVCLVIWGVVALRTRPQIGPAVGNRAPDFTVQTIDGESATLSDFRGKIVMLSFWNFPSHSWYPEYCLEEGHYMEAVLDEWPDEELVILTIAYESDGAAIQEFMAKHGFTFPLLIDSEGEVCADYDIVYDPTHFFIDTKGTIKAVMLGPFHSQDKIEGMLDSIKNKRQIKTAILTISNVSVSSITDTSAVITWVTDKPASSQVVIDEFGVSMMPEETPVTSHSVTVRGLAPDTIYHFRVLSGYNFENPTASERYSFATLTDASPPVIWYVDISNVAESSAVIEWETDEPATSEVEYWITDSWDSITVLDDELTTHHSVSLSELQPNTRYHLEVKSRDASGHEATLHIFAVATLPALPIGPKVGNRAPDFTLQTIGGKSVTLSDFRGKIVMLNFWLASCGACRDEMPHIQSVFDEWPDEELVILAVNVRESATAVQSSIESQGLTFPILLDSKGEADQVYRAPYFPTTFFIDGEGIIKEVKEGRFRSQEEIESIISSIIAGE